MQRNWILKALVAVGALVLFFFGFDTARSDPTLRALQEVSIAELESGKAIREGQFLSVKDAYLMPFAMVKTSSSRKRGDHAHVYAAFGSQAQQAEAIGGKTVTPVLWARLAHDYGTMAGAKAAMDADALYERPMPLSGTVGPLGADVQSEMSKNPNVKFNAPLFFEDGSSPMTLGNGMAMAVGGALLALAVVLWVVADVQAERWANALRRPDARVYIGRTAVLLAAVVGVPLFAAAGGIGIGEYLGEKTFMPLALGGMLLGLALSVWGFWRSRAAALLTNDSLELISNGGSKSVRFSEVTGLIANERKVKGVLVGTYTLQGPAKAFEVGNGLTKGGIDKLVEFSLELREIVTRLVGPKVFDALNRGQTVSFGPLGASASGLTKGSGNDVLPWAEIASAELKNGKLKVKQKGKLLGWGGFSAAKIVNIDLLMHLLQSKGL